MSEGAVDILVKARRQQHDKTFAHGMWVRIAWPTIGNLSSTEYRYVAFTDYDRMPDDNRRRRVWPEPQAHTDIAEPRHMHG